MLKFLMSSDRKRALQKLDQVGLSAKTCKLNTSFRSMALLVLVEVIRGKHLKVYLQQMQKVSLNPELILKYSVFIHILIQQRNHVDDKKLLAFLNKLMDACSLLIQKQLKQQNKDPSNKTNRSCCNRSSISTHSQDYVICKEVLLLSGVCKLYIGYLMKILSVFDSYRKFQRISRSYQIHQVWMMTNLLRTITSITAQFTNIGRYYMKPYGSLVVLLSKSLSRDISHLVLATGNYVESQSSLYNCLSKLQEGQTKLEQFVRLLEEISDLNQKLLPIYFGKYFFDSMRDVAEPKWVNINSEDFQTIFKLYEIWTRSTDTDEEFRVSKRKHRKNNRILATQ